MSHSLSERDSLGLCFTCRHVRPVCTDRGSVFYQCQRALTDPWYAKYPRLPVLQCRGHEKKVEPPESHG